MARPSLLLACFCLVLTGAHCHDEAAMEAAAEGGPAVDSLARATPRRLLVPRLAGDFPHEGCGEMPAECPPLTPGSEGFAGLAEATLRLAEADPDTLAPGALRARGVAELLWAGLSPASLERALPLLAEAAERLPRSKLLNDLAAAHMVRADLTDDPEALVDALELLEEVRTMDTALEPALFNRALVLDRFHLTWPATNVWSRFQATHPESPWAAEASRRGARDRARLDRITRPPAELVARAVEEGEEEAIREMAREHPQEAREHAMDELLPEWAVARGRGDVAGARRALEAAEVLGEELVDRSVADAVSVIRDAEARNDTAELTRLQEGLAALGVGRPLYAELRYTQAAGPLRDAARLLAPVPGSLGAWAEYWVAGVDMSQFRYDRAGPRGRAILEGLDAGRYPMLEGLVRWMHALIEVREGRYASSLAGFQRAAALAERAGERENLAFLQTLVAEEQKLLGHTSEAWRARIRALEGYAQAPPGRRLHVALWEAGDAAFLSGRIHAARAFQQVAVDVARTTRRPSLVVWALTRRARIHHALEDTRRALDDLEEARELVPEIPDGATRARRLADVHWVGGLVHGGSNPRAGAAMLDSAVAFHREAGNAVNLGEIYVDRARLNLAAGDLERADGDLRRALEVAEEARANVQSTPSGTAFARTLQGIFDEAVLLHAVRRGDPVTALRFGERARRLLGEAPARPSAEEGPPVPGLDRLDDDLAILEYALVGNRAMVWVLTREGITHVPLEASPEEIAGDAAELKRRIRTARIPAEIRSVGRRLHLRVLPDTVGRLVAGADLVVVPDKALNGVPFAALTDPATGRFVVEDRAVSVAPSATEYLEVLGRAGPAARPADALLVGRPELGSDARRSFGDLPAAEAEVDIVAGAYPRARRLVGSQATRRAVAQGMPPGGVFHFAGHAVFNPDRPAASHLLLAPEGAGEGVDRLYVFELADLIPHAPRMVVLSACGSLRPADDRGGGFWGLARPFLDAGASGVVGTFWEVGDETTVPLVTAFHRAWLDGMAGRQALRSAQRSLLESEDPRLRAPRVWAAFQLVGAAP